jgi:microsomal epoxide hydrolase
LPLLDHLCSTYTPDTLPVHVIVPSLIGYGFSSPPPIDKDFVTRDNAALYNALMKGLGFNKYIAQGGDVGSLVARFQGQDFDECTGESVLPNKAVCCRPANRWIPA